MKQVNVGIIGLGTIGKGVFDEISGNGDLIAERSGVKVSIKGVCDISTGLLSDLKGPEGMVVTSEAKELISSDDIDIIIELIGGISPAKEIILEAIRNKKHVVTANKALLSEHWEEIFAEASRHKVFVEFEASVGGAIPIIKVLRESFVGNNIKKVYGILNGTTNFILSEMSEKGSSFEDTLKVAQEKGFAESDPTLDISGKDSAHKLALLSLLGFGIKVNADDIFTEGITSISAQDIENAAKWGYAVKLLAIAKDSDDGIQLRVHPVLLSKQLLLSDIKGADNAVFVKGDYLDESLLFGKGAGQKPTASSVVGDVVGVAKHVAFYGKENPAEYKLVYSSRGKGVSKMEDLDLCYYLRFSVIDKPGVLAGISSVLADNNISIANVSQEERKDGEMVPVVILTHMAREGSLRKAIDEIDSMDFIADKTVVIRMEE